MDRNSAYYRQSVRLVDEQPPQLHLIPRKAIGASPHSSAYYPTPALSSLTTGHSGDNSHRTSGQGPSSHSNATSEEPEPVPLLQESREESRYQNGPKEQFNALPRKNSGPAILWWLAEILALLVSVLAFAMLIVILAHYNGQRQEEWPYNHFTVNSLVVLLTSLSRVALLLPVASCLAQAKWLYFSSGRGGVMHAKRLSGLDEFDDASRGISGSLTLLFKTKRGSVGSLGAILMILVLGFDVFSQQMISLTFELGNTTSSSTTAQVPRSETYAAVANDRSSISSPRADSRMQAAIMSGWMVALTSPPQAPCPEESCTFPTTPTLAMCGRCIDMTSSLSTNCSSSDEYCAFRLPSGNTLTSPPASDSQKLFQTFPVSADQPISALPDSASAALQFEAIGAPYQSASTTGVAASQCALFWCVQALNASTKNGITSETVVGNSTSMNSNLIFYDDLRNFNVAPGSSFRVNGRAAQAVRNSMPDMSSNVTTDSKSSAASASYKYSSELASAIWAGSHDWNSFISNWASTVSNTIRTSAPAPPSTRYAPAVMAREGFIHVRWAWLAYPASLILGTTILLSLTIMQTSKSNILPWKGSALAMLFTSVESEFLNEARGESGRRNGLARAVGTERVVLEQEDGAWLFRRPGALRGYEYRMAGGIG